MGEDIHPYGAASPCLAGMGLNTMPSEPCLLYGRGSTGHAAVSMLLRKLIGSSAGTELKGDRV